MKLPKMWRKKNGTKPTGNYHAKYKSEDINLGTSDAEEARRRLLEAIRTGRRNFIDELDEAVAATEPAVVPIAALQPPPPAAPSAPPVAAQPPAVTPDVVIPPPPAPPIALLAPVPAASDHAETQATNEAAAETSYEGTDQAGAGDANTPPEITGAELAELAVDAQVWCAAEYARAKVYRGFQTPVLPDEGKKALAGQWRKIIEYSGAAAMLPPWVTGLLIPGCVLVTATFAMARGFAEVAKEQKARQSTAQAAAAGAGDPVRVVPEAAAA